MASEQKLEPQLVMKRNSLEELPVINLPDGITLRTFRKGDEADWERIILDSFGETLSFDTVMAKDASYKPERVLFVCFDHQPVATASAWFRPKWGNETGYLHMVGCTKAHLGKNLGKLVSLAALHHMKNEGKQSAILETDDFRIPAIKTYLKLGFEPHIIHENQRLRWEKIRGML